MTAPPAPEQLARLHEALEAESGSAYLLDSDLSIRYVNESWRRFARDNGAPGLASDWASANVFGVCSTPGLRAFFETRFRRVLATREAWSHEYECSSMDVYRKFNMRVEPTNETAGLTVVHSLVVEGEQCGDNARDPRHEAFTNEHGFLIVCEACGRLRRARETSNWAWVPGLVRPNTPNVSNGVCPTCEIRFYG